MKSGFSVSNKPVLNFGTIYQVQLKNKKGKTVPIYSADCYTRLPELSARTLENLPDAPVKMLYTLCPNIVLEAIRKGGTQDYFATMDEKYRASEYETPDDEVKMFILTDDSSSTDATEFIDAVKIKTVDSDLSGNKKTVELQQSNRNTYNFIKIKLERFLNAPQIIIQHLPKGTVRRFGYHRATAAPLFKRVGMYEVSAFEPDGSIKTLGQFAGAEYESSDSYQFSAS